MYLNIKIRRVLWDLVKSIGSVLFQGKELVSIALPVYINESRSFLQRVTDQWSTIRLLSKAKDKSYLEKFLSVVAFSIGGLIKTALLLKPFNPILGLFKNKLFN